MAVPPLNRILFVEDDPDIQIIARIALERIGKFTLAMCGSGAEALDLAPEFKPDLIILDVMMPVMDGLTTYQALKKIKETSSTPAIFMTAKAQSHEISEYKAMGVIEVIVKPFDPFRLASIIRTCWDACHP